MRVSILLFAAVQSRFATGQLVFDGSGFGGGGFGGFFPSDTQSDAPSDVPSEAPSDVPSEMPSDVPTSVPTHQDASLLPSFTSDSFPVCDICRTGMIGDANGILLLDSDSITCEVAEATGALGLVPPETCLLYQAQASSVCQCQPGLPPATDPTSPCVIDSCSRFDTIADLSTVIQNGALSTNYCLCEATYNLQNGGCSNNRSDTISIAASQNITLECAGAGCTFSCPAASFLVGGSLQLRRATLSGGTGDSRVVVQQLGVLDGEELTFRDSLSQETLSSAQRRLQVGSPGNGGCLQNFGTVRLATTTFENCTASYSGGAIWTSGELEVYQTMFRDNHANIGGAMYIDSGSTKVSGAEFTDNEDATGAANVYVGPQGQFGGCEVVGLEEYPETGLACTRDRSGGSASAEWRSLGRLVPWLLLVVLV